MSDALKYLMKKKEELGSIGALDYLISLEKRMSGVLNIDTPASHSTAVPVTYTPFFSKPISLPKDINKFKKKPSVLPDGFELPPLRGVANDYQFLLDGLDNSPT